MAPNASQLQLLVSGRDALNVKPDCLKQLRLCFVLTFERYCAYFNPYGCTTHLLSFPLLPSKVRALSVCALRKKLKYLAMF
jgi:hypothetical protein